MSHWLHDGMPEGQTRDREYIYPTLYVFLLVADVLPPSPSTSTRISAFPPSPGEYNNDRRTDVHRSPLPHLNNPTFFAASNAVVAAPELKPMRVDTVPTSRVIGSVSCSGVSIRTTLVRDPAIFTIRGSVNGATVTGSPPRRTS
ncbi:hypothetical protein AIIKEEIJ_01594 [Rhodococcus sp. YH1]|nr:hypothetical protein [Rhodococcus sp. YH1]